MQETGLITAILDIIKPIIIGFFGGVASIFVSGKKPSASTISSAIFVSGFSGWLGGKLASALELSPDYRDVVIGVAGFLGAGFLSMVSKTVMAKFGTNDVDTDC